MAGLKPKIWKKVLREIFLKVVQSLPRAMGEFFVTAGAQAGVKKFSELRGQKAREVAAATRVADEFMSALTKSAQGFASSHCTLSLREKLREQGLSQLLQNIDLRAADWKWEGVEDSSERNRWGWSELTFRGSLMGATAGGQSDSVGRPLEVALVKEKDVWRVFEFSF